MTSTPRHETSAPASAPKGEGGARLGVNRKLHIGHFAFMRAVLQGMDTQASWNRYLKLEGEGSDIRRVRRTIQWIRDEFAAAARRADRPGTARLIMIDASRVDDVALTLPTLDEFADAHDLQDFSYAEQLEHYESVYGRATQRQSRRSRLIAKQLDALHWLERVAAEPPRLDDRVATWLAPALAERLDADGIATLAQLVERINGIGRRWWAGIPAIGSNKAERILDWLRMHEATLGTTIGSHVMTPRSRLQRAQLDAVVAPTTAIVPLEKLVVPPELDGTDGRFRAPLGSCLLAARNDYEAVMAWLDTKEGGKRGGSTAMPPEAESPKRPGHTQRAYRKEVERFMLWAIIEKKKALSSMSADDCKTYGEFLAYPLPAELWCGRRGRERWSPLWRPFEGPLSLRARRQAITILKNLGKFLASQGYLAVNPWEGVVLPAEVKPRTDTRRSFSPAHWDLIQEQLQALPESSASHRLRIALALLYDSGVRPSEIVHARFSDLRRTGMNEEWLLRIEGEEGRGRSVPLSVAVVRGLSAYLASRSLDADPLADANRDAYLLGKAIDVATRAPWSHGAQQTVNPAAGITTSTLYDQLKDFFVSCARELARRDIRAELSFTRASAHWLRHTYGLRRLDEGTPVDALQKDMGHKAIETTLVYLRRKAGNVN